MGYKNEDLKKIQDTILNKIKNETSDLSFDSLFSSGSFLLKSLDNNRAVFVSESDSSATFINNSIYPSKIKEILEQLTSNSFEIEIISKDEYNNKFKKEKDPSIMKKVFPNSALDSNFTFDNFITGSSNKQAYTASLYSVDYPGKYNPIFIYSKSGLGKTHLLHAIGNKYHEKFPNKKIQYITTSVFIDTIFNYFRNDQNIEVEALKNFFYDVDLLLIDDIQFLKDKTTVQMIFFDIFNLLVSNGKQIIITSDVSPKELKGLEDRLVSRFTGGLSIPITCPDKKTMKDILKSKIVISGTDLSIFDEDALDYIVAHHSKNVRELEGALTTVVFNMVTCNPTGNITLQFVENVFSEEVKIVEKKGKVTIDSIISDVSDYYSLTSSQLRSKIRTSQIALARQIAMYLSRTVLSEPYQVIGREFQKDHSTVVANVSKIEEQMKKDTQLKKTIDELTKIVTSRTGN